jgi:WD40 repeat protein
MLASQTNGGIQVLNVKDMSKTLDFAQNVGTPRIELSPDGKLIAIGDSLSNGGAVLRRLPSGAKVAPLFMGRAWVFGVAFSPDSKYLALCGQKNEVLVIDTQTLEEKLLLPTPGLENYWVGFSPDGKTLAAVGVNEKVRLWSFPAGKSLTK